MNNAFAGFVAPFSRTVDASPFQVAVSYGLLGLIVGKYVLKKD